jgi:lysophospholipase L1-like esterase
VAVSKVAFLGDSITRGTYLNYSAPYKYTSYANRFREIYNNTEIQAIDGYTTQYWIKKLPEVETKYDVVFVMLGVNDSGQGLSPEGYISNLKQIKSLLGCRVVFFTPTPLYYVWEEQNKIISSYANAIKTEFPDSHIDLTKITFEKADYFSDDAHLLDSGHMKVFTCLMDYVNLHFTILP